MKLITAIVNKDDAYSVQTSLTSNGFQVTRLATTGGFLRAGNTTLLLGVEEDRIQEAVHVIESVCKSRKTMTSAPAALTGVTHGEYTTYPVEVTVGGATLFILSIEQFLKV